MIQDISNDVIDSSHTVRVSKSKQAKHIEALEALVDELRLQLSSTCSVTVKEVTPKDMVSLETYNKLLKLYNDLWDETMPF
ncbi:MAG: hypothetical protein JHC33_13610 [Ignisphaera sp.]|nr:hypothetical protein [Ignisphaera sp.]